MYSRTGWLSVFATLLLLSAQATGGDEPTVAKDVRQFDIVIENRHIKGGLTKITVYQGQWLRLVWLSDEPVDIHLHGYDIQLRIEANIPADMTLKAHATGRFPITSHGFGPQKGKGEKHQHGALLYLEVYPN